MSREAFALLCLVVGGLILGTCFYVGEHVDELERGAYAPARGEP